MSDIWPPNQPMTDEEYVTGNNFRCPNQNCPTHHGSSIEFQATYGSWDQVGKTIYQSVTCDICGSQWEDAYLLDGYCSYVEGINATAGA